MSKIKFPHFFSAVACLMLMFVALSTSGCGGESGPRKLQPADDIDWDAVNAQSEADNTSSGTNE